MADPFHTSSGVAVQGDPVVALAAQVNRINGKAQFAPAPGQLSVDLALAALVIMQTITIAAAVSDPLAVDQLNAITAAFKSNPVGYVAPRITQITQAIAIYGDTLGIPPAKIGITQKDPRFSIKWDGWMWVGALAAGATALLGAVVGARRLALRARSF